MCSFLLPLIFVMVVAKWSQSPILFWVWCRFRRAQLALQRGEEDLAREALKRRKSYAVRYDIWKIVYVTCCVKFQWSFYIILDSIGSLWSCCRCRKLLLIMIFPVYLCRIMLINWKLNLISRKQLLTILSPTHGYAKFYGFCATPLVTLKLMMSQFSSLRLNHVLCSF